MGKEVEKVTHPLEILPRDAMSPEELRRIDDLVKSQDKTVLELIPADISSDDLWRTMYASAKALRNLEEAKCRLKPLFGRMLCVLEDKQELITGQGYRNFNDFMSRGAWELFHISRAEAYNMKKIAEELGNVAASVVAEIGISKTNMVAKALRSRIAVGTPPEIAETTRAYWLEKARTLSYDELKLAVYDQNLAEEGELDYSDTIIPGTKDVRSYWNEFRKAPHVIGIVGSEQPGQILKCCLMECDAEWRARFEEAIRVREA